MEEKSREVKSLTLLSVALAALALLSCPSGFGAPSARIIVTAAGRIGPLHVDKSDRAEVIAFAGQPDSEVRGRYASYPGFDALAYGCAGRPATGRDGEPHCKTVFYLDARSNKLGLLYTEDPRYSNLYGFHVGTPTGVAEHALHRIVYVGCLARLTIVTKTAFLAMVFAGGKDRVVSQPTSYVHLAGGYVGSIIVHSQRLNPGVLDCIDS